MNVTGVSPSSRNKGCPHSALRLRQHRLVNPVPPDNDRAAHCIHRLHCHSPVCRLDRQTPQRAKGRKRRFLVLTLAKMGEGGMTLIFRVPPIGAILPFTSIWQVERKGSELREFPRLRHEHLWPTFLPNHIMYVAGDSFLLLIFLYLSKMDF